MAKLRDVSVSQGLMLESASASLLGPGGPHAGCATKQPRLRLKTIERAGRLRVPFTTGLLLGIGEERRCARIPHQPALVTGHHRLPSTAQQQDQAARAPAPRFDPHGRRLAARSDVIDGLLAIRRLHARFGHVQEVILQPFRAKAGTALARTPGLPEAELLWAACAARLLLGDDIPIQSPPNLSADPDALGALLACGVSDWGGISPVTADHVNPEAAWPEIATLRAWTEQHGHTLAPRLPVYPRYAAHRSLQSTTLRVWQSARVAKHVRRLSDAQGLARSELPASTGWYAGVSRAPPDDEADDEARWLPFGREHDSMDDWRRDRRVAPSVRAALLAAVDEGTPLSLRQIEALLSSRGPDCAAVCRAADEARQRARGGGVSYAADSCSLARLPPPWPNSYTNKCSYACSFCAFSKGKRDEDLRGAPYELDTTEVARRTAEAWARGATEVCMQGGIHPSYDGESYLAFLRAAHAGAPGVHVHAFSPLEAWHGAQTLGLPPRQYLDELRDAGLGSLPGTAAEVLSDDVRGEICPDKLSTAEWLHVVGEAHAAGLHTTSTLMFGHTEGVGAWARHLMKLRVAQLRSARRGSDAAITEFVPLPFVHTEAPVYRTGGARRGPTLREAVLVHAAARLALAPHVANVQVA
eukprot:450090-Prymnesium_polylepis.1